MTAQANPAAVDLNTPALALPEWSRQQGNRVDAPTAACDQDDSAAATALIMMSQAPARALKLAVPGKKLQRTDDNAPISPDAASALAATLRRIKRHVWQHTDDSADGCADLADCIDAAMPQRMNVRETLRIVNAVRCASCKAEAAARLAAALWTARERQCWHAAVDADMLPLEPASLPLQGATQQPNKALAGWLNGGHRAGKRPAGAGDSGAEPPASAAKQARLIRAARVDCEERGGPTLPECSICRDTAHVPAAQPQQQQALAAQTGRHSAQWTMPCRSACSLRANGGVLPPKTKPQRSEPAADITAAVTRTRLQHIKSRLAKGSARSAQHSQLLLLIDNADLARLTHGDALDIADVMRQLHSTAGQAVLSLLASILGRLNPSMHGTGVQSSCQLIVVSL